MRFRKVTIIKTSAPEEGTVNEKLQWLAGSLGLFTKRDKDRSCFRVFIELLRKAKTGEGMTSDELAERLNLTRGTVVYHLNRLEAAGIVENSKNKYYLTKDNLQSAVKEISQSLNEVMKEIEEYAKQVDKLLGLKSTE